MNPKIQSRPDHSTNERTLWHELLHAAFGGLFPNETQLEAMLDRLERMP